MKVCGNKYCIHKGKLQPLSNFHKRTASIDGLQSRCKDCKKERQKTENYKENQRENLKTDKSKSYRKKYWRSDKGKSANRRNYLNNIKPRKHKNKLKK